MEDDLKIIKVEYLSNHWSDLLQILNLCRGDQTKIKYLFKWRGPQIEDNLKIIKVEYLSKRWSDLPQILYISSWDQKKIKMLEMNTTYNGRRPQKMKSWISQQPLTRSSSNFKFMQRGPNVNKTFLEMKTTS